MPRSDNRFDRSRSSGKKPSFKPDRKESGEKKSYKSKDSSFRSDKPRFDKRERSGDDKKEGGSKRFSKPFKKREEGSGEKRSFGRKKSYGDKDRGDRKPFDRDKKPFRKKFGEEKSFGEKDRGERRSFDRDKKPFRKKFNEEKSFGEKKSYGDKDKGERKSFARDKKPFHKKHDDEGGEKRSFNRDDKDFGEKRRKFKPHGKRSFSKKSDDFIPNPDGLTRLNKYLSNAGICSRREADDLIRAGAVSVNGKVITEMGFKVKSDDKISYGGETLRHEKKVYIILNKPKDYITTTDDPQERRTVMELIAGACKERVYPVGRLDRNTTGLLLFTNDGELATKLMHPKFGIKKVYQVTLDKNLRTEDYERLTTGFELEDGFIKPDELSFINNNKKELGIEIHSGRNRIVRRIFEYLGYEVVKLDRVVFAGLTKKDLPRASWRFLNEKEVGFLKMIG